MKLHEARFLKLASYQSVGVIFEGKVVEFVAYLYRSGPCERPSECQFFDGRGLGLGVCYPNGSCDTI